METVCFEDPVRRTSDEKARILFGCCGGIVVSLFAKAEGQSLIYEYCGSIV
jgi:hypothetical protein